jgi:transposase
MGKKSRKGKGRRREASRPRIDLKLDELPGLVERAKQVLSPEDHATLEAMTQTLTFVARELLSKTTTIERLRHLLFESKTEKTSSVLGDRAAAGTSERKRGAEQKRPGHGRNGAAAYTGAKKVKIAHPSLQSGCACPECEKGRVYPLREPATLVRITGVAPLEATVYEKDRWRCNLCGEVFTAPSPEGVGEKKYDEKATATVGLLKYGTGLPFNRIEKLQAAMGIPLPAATQWELVSDGAESMAPAHEELIHQAARGEVLHNDDTTMKVLELTAEQRAAAIGNDAADERTGVFTSGIVATAEGHRIALFFTGAKHAGENLSDVLASRERERPPPIQMCDALSANTAGGLDTILANCMAHGRRKFVGVADNFPAECRRVLEALREVYKNDAFAKKNQMSAADRLRFHQTESGPLLMELETWMKGELAEHRVEPNSGLGEAIRYMLKHWSALTLFLREPGAPLDNNICERALKKAILHRKNALFYRTLNGAHVGDVFMSLIHSAELNGAKPFDYLVALLRHHEEVKAAPAEWMPWNYSIALARAREGRAPPTAP